MVVFLSRKMGEWLMEEDEPCVLLKPPEELDLLFDPESLPDTLSYPALPPRPPLLLLFPVESSPSNMAKSKPDPPAFTPTEAEGKETIHFKN